MHEGIERFHAEMIATLGYAPEHIEFGRLHRFPTSSKRGDPSGWCVLFEDGRAGKYGCWRRDISVLWTAEPLRRMTFAERTKLCRQVAQEKARRDIERRITWRENRVSNAYMLRQCVRVTEDDPVHRYLCRRLAMESFAVPECILLHPAMPYFFDGEVVGSWPAMVAPLSNREGDVLALHRTYLDADGNKAPVPGPVKKFTSAAGLLTSASIPLHLPAAGVLGVSEGIETALASCCASAVPTVAACSASALAAFAWPPGLQRLVIFADADRAGRDAAEALRNRAARARLRCEVVTPSSEGTDWCDVWVSSRRLSGKNGGRHERDS